MFEIEIANRMADAAVANTPDSSIGNRSVIKKATLNLSNLRLSASDAARNLHDLREDETITRVDLSGNPGIFLDELDKDGLSTIDELCSLLAENKTVTAIDLSGTGLDFACAKKLAQSLRRNTFVKSLGLKNCPAAAPVLSALLMR